MYLLNIRDLYKSFGRIRALNGINLQVGRGVTGLIGPNGAGKTTTIKIALGLLKADKGFIEFFGLNPWTMGHRIKKKVGVLHEGVPLPEYLVVEDYLKYVAFFRELKEPKEAVREVLKLVGAERFKHRRIGELSAGMRQRVGLAQALLGFPELVILDEPLAYLDPGGRSELLDLIESLHRDRGMSFLILSHILAELERVCDRAAIIFRGKVIAEGSVRELAKKYQVTEYALDVFNPDLWFKYLKDLEVVEDIRLDTSKGRLYVKISDIRAFEREVHKIALKYDLYLISLRPRYGLLEQIYRKAVGDVSGEAQ
ncbi:MAG: hypothetical protein DRJ51_04315 [Thermoprotei archaeon]|nr:MAG: hypothetical protein DRJ51_04315 [Thermoprotei archaeon]RLF01850.1 MAG: hypothetical protein DRJ59_05135 [Thermoprotei archaeon]